MKNTVLFLEEIHPPAPPFPGWAVTLWLLKELYQ